MKEKKRGNKIHAQLKDNHISTKKSCSSSVKGFFIFIHDCFWHGHKDCKFYTVPKTNTEFWTAKVARNQERDQEVWRQLEAKGWAVIIVWECQLKSACFKETVQQVEAEILGNGERLTREREERRASRQAYLKDRKARKEREASLLVSLKNRR